MMSRSRSQGTEVTIVTRDVFHSRSWKNYSRVHSILKVILVCRAETTN